VNPLFVVGNRPGCALTSADLLQLAPADSPAVVSSEFEAQVNAARARGAKNPVTSALIAQFRAPMIYAGLFKFTNSCLNLVPPIMLNNLLKFLAASLAGTAANTWEGWVWACALFFSMFIRTFIENQYFHGVMRVGFQVRTALTTAVYRKALRLSPAARQDAPTGQIVNLMQLDATRLDTMMTQLHVAWDGLFQIITNMILLGIYIGPSALAGLASMLLLIPLNFCSMMRIAGLRRAIVKENDARVKVMNEVLQGVRAVKLYAWEDFFARRVLGIRERELAGIRGYALQSAVNSTLMQTAPIIVAVVTFLVYAGSGGAFTAAVIFTALAILNQLRFPLMFYPMVISQLADAKVSLERLNKFMESSEIGGGGGAGAGGVADAASGPDEEDPRRLDAVAVDIPAAAPLLPVAPPLLGASAAAAAALPEGAAAICVAGGTFFWEEPTARRARLAAKAADEAKGKVAKAKAALAKAKREKKGVDDAAAGVAAAETAAAAPPPPPPPAPPALAGVTFAVPKGQLWAVVGPVGVGKSALCAALLGELAPAPGAVATVAGSVAYVAQTAWVLNATLKANVVFAGDSHAGGGGAALGGAGRAESGQMAGGDAAARCLDEDFYARVLDACALRADLAALPAGDATEIGERGINLSGGQKARVSLARAAYMRADVVVLDDPLSALDAEVGKAVFSRVIGGGGVMGGATRLLVTNALQFLPECDGVLLLEAAPGGAARLAAAGTYAELLAASAPFRALIDAYGQMAGGDEGAAGAVSSGGGNEKKAAGDAVPGAPAAAAAAAAAAASPSAAAPSPGISKPGVGEKGAAVAGVKLMSEEDKREGAVSGAFYMRYIRAGGPLWLTVPILALAFLCMQLSQLVSQWWLTFWTSDAYYLLHPLGFYMGVFFALGAASAVFAFTRVTTTALMGISASRALHGWLLRAVLAAPMSFFDTTPVGRLISRFTKDMDAVDMTLPQSLGMLGTCVVFLVGSTAAIIFAVPWFALAFVPMAVVYVYIMIYFRTVAREVKRLDSITRSPIYAHFSESLGGLSTIRAYKLAGVFSATNEARVADNIAAYYTLKACDRWLSVRLETLGNAVVLATALLCVGTLASASTARGSGSGLTGFALTYAMAVTGMANWLVRTAAEAEQNMTSVERVTHYLDHTAGEAYAPPPGAQPPPPGWPATGALAFSKFTMRYREDTPEVLKGVTFDVRAGERVGVVGRTGSGKSSVLVSLFRLIEAKCHGGTVALDGVDIDGVGLKQLRSSLAIIPQDPTVFSGTLRANLDPTEALGPGGGPAPDAALWAALEKVGLKEWAARLEGGLDAPVAEFGESMSVGQRQLVCLCRVLLRADKVSLLALDEASASLDHVSDAALQKVLKENFSHATHLVVAHRCVGKKASPRATLRPQRSASPTAPPTAPPPTPAGCTPSSTATAS
jgi:ABC-type multidrug transport system fused ATPase/permease subunit